MFKSISERFRTSLSNSLKLTSTFSNRNLTSRYVNHLLLISVVLNLTSFAVSSYQCFFFFFAPGQTTKLLTLTSKISVKMKYRKAKFITSLIGKIQGIQICEIHARGMDILNVKIKNKAINKM